MLGLQSRNQGPWLGSIGNELAERTGLANRRDRGGPSTALLITGAVVIGLGLLAWTYLGPDIKRYIRIRNM
jgi:hypothetical protein